MKLLAYTLINVREFCGAKTRNQFSNLALCLYYQ
jgi:hypothetical protein